MFITQVIFESEKENEARIKEIMNKKRSDAEASKEIISHEIWWKEDTNTVGFSLVMKWSEREHFTNWMKETHKDGHKKPAEGGPKIIKTLNRFESIK